MEYIDNDQLNARIESFLERKHQQYPELSLRRREKRGVSIGDVVTTKFLELMNHGRFAKYVQ